MYLMDVCFILHAPLKARQKNRMDGHIAQYLLQGQLRIGAIKKGALNLSVKIPAFKKLNVWKEQTEHDQYRSIG